MKVGIYNSCHGYKDVSKLSPYVTGPVKGTKSAQDTPLSESCYALCIILLSVRFKMLPSKFISLMVKLSLKWLQWFISYDQKASEILCATSSIFADPVT